MEADPDESRTRKEEKKMFVADRMIVIHDRENSIVSYDMIEKLNKMLTEYGVDHAFTLYDSNNQDTDVAFNLLYEEKNETLVEVICILWAKTERKFNDEKIREMMRRAAK